MQRSKEVPFGNNQYSLVRKGCEVTFRVHPTWVGPHICLSLVSCAPSTFYTACHSGCGVARPDIFHGLHLVGQGREVALGGSRRLEGRTCPVDRNCVVGLLGLVPRRSMLVSRVSHPSLDISLSFLNYLFPTEEAGGISLSTCLTGLWNSTPECCEGLVDSSWSVYCTCSPTTMTGVQHVLGRCTVLHLIRSAPSANPSARREYITDIECVRRKSNRDRGLSNCNGTRRNGTLRDVVYKRNCTMSGLRLMSLLASPYSDCLAALNQVSLGTVEKEKAEIATHCLSDARREIVRVDGQAG